jgi:hypothetical protein
MAKYRVVQPWGPDKGRQVTLQSEHATVAEAFAALDAISAAMARTGAPSDALELLVVDDDGRLMGRLSTERRRERRRPRCILPDAE